MVAAAPATAPAAGNASGAAAASIPFSIASRQQSRASFNIQTTTLGASLIPIAPIMIPAMGYLRFLRLEVTLTAVGGTPTFNPDAPWNLFASIEFRNSAGNDIIVPVSGWKMYTYNKYGAQTCQAPMSDKRLGRQYSAASGSAHFFLDIPFEIDSETGLGTVPCLASNRSYQVAFQFNATSVIYSSAPTSATVTVDATAYYWSVPAGSNGQVTQGTQPDALGSVAVWQIDAPPLTPGDKLIRSVNTGNVLRTIILTIRNAAGARIDTNGVPPYIEMVVDNDVQYHIKNTEWEQLMCEWYNFQATSKDVAGGLDTGVYCLPFFALSAGYAGDPSASRAQFLVTLDATLLQFRGTWGSAAATLEIDTNGFIPTSSAALYAK